MSHHRRKQRPLLNYESRQEPLATPRVFRLRMLQSGTIMLGAIVVSLAAGVAGYHWIGGLESWVDCLYNASMILGGMGPVAELKSDAGKVFASIYALYSGIALLASVGVLLSPVLHRVLHRFHIDAGEDASG